MTTIAPATIHTMPRHRARKRHLATLAVIYTVTAVEILPQADHPWFYMPTDLGPHYAYTPGPSNLYNAWTVGSNTGWRGYLAPYDPS